MISLRRHIAYIMAAVGVTLFLSAAAQSQAPFYYTVRPQGHGMRAAALADASSADASNVTGMFWNPASLSFLGSGGIIGTHTLDVKTRLQSEYLAGVVQVGRGLTVAASGVYAHAGKLEPEGGPVVSLKVYGADLAGSYAILPTLSVGGLFGARKAAFDGESRTMGWGQIGMFYFPSPGISYGMAYRVIRGYTYWYANNQSGVEPEPDLIQNLEIGATMSYPARAERPIVTLSLTTEKSFPGVSLFSTKGGLEVLPTQFLSLRLGFKVGTLERVARYGFGLHFGRVHVDFASGPSRAENRFSGVSLMVNL